MHEWPLPRSPGAGPKSFDELKATLRDLLNERDKAAAGITFQREEAPFERAVALWNERNGEPREELNRAVLKLVEEATTTPWQPKQFNELSLLLDALDLREAVLPLKSTAESQSLLEYPDGAQLHMLVLRTLLALDWNGDLEFWRMQKDTVGHRWPGLIFQGLALLNIERAFDQLPEIVSGEEGMRQVLQLFPGLAQDLSLDPSTLEAHAVTICDRLQPEASQALRRWIALS